MSLINTELQPVRIPGRTKANGAIHVVTSWSKAEGGGGLNNKMYIIIQAMVRTALSLFLLFFFFSSSRPVASAKNITSSLLSISRWRNWRAALLKPITSWGEGTEDKGEQTYHRDKTTRCFSVQMFTDSDFRHFWERVGPQLIDDGQQHLVTGDLTKMDPGRKQWHQLNTVSTRAITAAALTRSDWL